MENGVWKVVRGRDVGDGWRNGREKDLERLLVAIAVRTKFLRVFLMGFC